MEKFLAEIGNEPWKILIGLVGAMIVAYLTVTLALGRFKREKLWEKRLAVYSDLFEGMSEMLRVDEIWYRREKEERAENEEYEAELMERYRKARATTESASALAKLLPDDDVVKIIDEFWMERDASRQQWAVSAFDLLEAYGGDVTATQKAIAGILKIARNHHVQG